MAGAFDALLAGASGGRLSSQEQQLRTQILQQWGGSGQWDNDSVDLAGDLARRMYASGITDLSKLKFTPTKRRELTSAEYVGTDEYRPATYTEYDNAFDLTYDGKAVGSKGFIGDINRDGSLGDGNVFSSNTYHPNLLAWNSGGKGAHNYEVSFDEKGNPIVKPVFQSSSFWNSDLGGLTKAAAMAAGMYGAATGLAGTGTAAPGATTTGGLAAPGATTTGLGAVEFGAITPEMLAGSGTAIQGGGVVGGTAGLSGVGLSGLDAAMLDMGAGATNVGAGAGAATGGATAGLSGGGGTNWLKTAWDGAGNFLNSGWGKALVTAGGLAMTKDAEQGAPDPMLKEGADGVKDIAKDAKDRAASADEEWNSIFMPRYLGLMDRADRRDQELYDFNMGRARLAARQMDRFYSQVDAYDDEGNRERLAGEAGATAEQNNSAGMEQMRRNIGRMGFNPNSGVMLSQMRQGAQQGALNKTLAMNMAREAARREGLNLRATAAGLRGADSAYAGNAAAGADIGLRGTAAGQQGFSNRDVDWRGNMGLGMQGYGQLGSWGLGRSNSADQLNAANVAGWNGLIGYGLGSLWNQPARKG